MNGVEVDFRHPSFGYEITNQNFDRVSSQKLLTMTLAEQCGGSSAKNKSTPLLKVGPGVTIMIHYHK